MLATWVHSIDPFLIHFPDGWPLPGIRWYGLSYAAGFLAAGLILRGYMRAGKVALRVGEDSALLTYLIFGVLLGGRLGYCLLYDTSRFLQAPWILFELSGGGIAGMASHGGFLGVCIAVLLFAKRFHKNRWLIADAVVSLTPPGLFFGRIANFINGELWGKVTTMPWGVIFPQSVPYSGYPLSLVPVRHPSQLYEAGLEGLVLGVYLQWRFWRGGFKPGSLVAEFLIFYGLLRILGECFREPDASLILGCNRGIVYSVITCVVGFFLWVWRRGVRSVSLPKQ